MYVCVCVCVYVRERENREVFQQPHPFTIGQTPPVKRPRGMQNFREGRERGREESKAVENIDRLAPKYNSSSLIL